MRCVEGIQNGDVIGVAMQQSGERNFLAPNCTNSFFRCNANHLLYLSTLDLPMLQFFHNGEPLYDIAVNRYVIELDKRARYAGISMLRFLYYHIHYEFHAYRFRGVVYPSVSLPSSAENDLKVTAVLAEDVFKQASPAPKFRPIIVARSIV